MNEICKVPCPSVDRKLENKVSYLVFSLVLGGLLAVAIFFGETSVRRQESMSKTLVKIQESVGEIKGELKYLNGRKGIQ